MSERLTIRQREILTWLADGAVTKTDRNQDGWLDRERVMSADGVDLGVCSYATWASLIRRGLATWTHPNEPNHTLLITDEGRASL